MENIMFGLWKHTRHYWVPYVTPSTVKNSEDSIMPYCIIYTEKCYGCGRLRTITIEHEKPPVIRESEES
jgi:hypothetical protein